MLGKSLCIYYTKIKGEEPHKPKTISLSKIWPHLYILKFPTQFAICGILHSFSDHT